MARHGLWPTPTAGDAKGSGSRNLPGSKAHAGVSLTDAVRFGNSNTPRTLPTPQARDWKGGFGQSHTKGGRDLATEAARWPTPTAQDAAGPAQMRRNSLPLNAAAGGALNPTWVEVLMGFPENWTRL